METYFRYKTDDPDKVNALFTRTNGNNLFHADNSNNQLSSSRVDTEKSTIMEDIPFIQVDPEQKHLRYIRTIDVWDRASTSLAIGTGQIKLSGRELNDAEKAIIDFVVNHDDLFSEIIDESEQFYKPVETQRGWWKLTWTGVDELDDFTIEHIAELISDGYTQGEIIQE